MRKFARKRGMITTQLSAYEVELLTSLVKGPPGEQKLLDASVAHQIFGRAGRPQFDTQGYVVAMAHEDDVKILVIGATTVFGELQDAMDRIWRAPAPIWSSPPRISAPGASWPSKR